MQYLLTSNEMKAADEYTSRVIGIPSIVLMERAALAVAEEIRKLYPDPDKIRVMAACGMGNNGADAAAAGRILTDWGYQVRFVFTRPFPSDVNKNQPLTNMEIQKHILDSYGMKSETFVPEEFENFRPDVIIDGLFGTGLSREVRSVPAAMIGYINRQKEDNHSFIVSIDIPSGISSDTGEVMGCAVRADLTVALAFYKRGHFAYPGTEYCGRSVLRKIGITEKSFEKTPVMFTYDTENACDLLPKRRESGNKGTFGKLLIIAGSINVSGAATMCASSAYRSGCGMVKVFTPEINRVIMQTTVPESLLTCYPNDLVNGLDEARLLLQTDLAWCDTVIIGPGLGRTKEAAQLLSEVLTYGASHNDLKGIVIDADAVRLTSDYDLYELLKRAGSQTNIILTPHLAECAALLRCDIRELKENETEFVKSFAQISNTVLLCKDARSVASSKDHEQIYMNTSGNSSLAKAGSGDILAGIAGSFLAQGMNGFEAACAASYFHGRAAQLLSDKTHFAGKRAVMAMDLTEAIKEIV